MRRLFVRQVAGVGVGGMILGLTALLALPEVSTQPPPKSASPLSTKIDQTFACGHGGRTATREDCRSVIGVDERAPSKAASIAPESYDYPASQLPSSATDHASRGNPPPTVDEVGAQQQMDHEASVEKVRAEKRDAAKRRAERRRAMEARAQAYEYDRGRSRQPQWRDRSPNIGF